MAEPSFDFNAFLNSASTAPSPDTAQQQHPTGAVHNRRGSNTADYGGHQLHEEDRSLLPAWATATERTNDTPARHSSILDSSVPTQRRQEVIQQPQPEPQQQADQVNRAHAHATQQYRARIAEHHNRTMHPNAEAGSSQHKSSGRENAASQAAVGQSLSSSSVNDGKAGAPPAQTGRRSRESTLPNSKQFPPAAAPYGTAGPFTAAAVTPSTSRLSLQERRRFSQIASEATRSDSRSNPPNSNSSSSSGNTHSQNQSESSLGRGDSAPGVNTAVTPKRNIKRAREAGRAAANAAADQDVQSNSYNGDISKSVSPGDGSEPAMTSLSPLSNLARSVLRSNEGEIALPSDFDVSEALAKVATRKNPSIQLGPIGPSCAFTIADALHPNQPLIYVSETFTRLTGYEPADVLGKNCLFLQAPNGDVNNNNNSNPAGAKRRSSDGRAVAHIKKHLGQMRECQASLINYKKNGKAFINLVTMVPIPWGPDGDGEADSDIVRYFVGFQVDLAEQPGAVLSKDANGYVVDYTTSGGLDRQGGSTGSSAPPPPTLTASELFQEAREEKTRQVNGAHELADRVKTGEAGVRSWARFLLDNAHDLIYVLSLKGVFLYVSPSVERILGFEPEALIGHSIAEFCHPSDVVPVFRELKDSTSNASIASAARSSVDARGGYQAMTRGGAGQSGPQVNLLLRMRHRHLGHQWIESVGKLHLNQGKGRKVVISSGRPRAVYNLGWDQLRQTAVENPMGAPAPGPAFWVKVSLDGLVLSSKSRTAAVLGCTPAMLQGQHLMEMCNGEAVRAIGEALRSRRVSRVAHMLRDTVGRGELVAVVSTFCPSLEQAVALGVGVGSGMKRQATDLSSSSLASASDGLPMGVDMTSMPSSNSNSNNSSSVHSSSSNSSSSNQANPVRDSTASVFVHIRRANGEIPLEVNKVTYVDDMAVLNKRQRSEQAPAHGAKTKTGAGPGPGSVFTELDPNRNTSWVFELHQLQIMNRKLREEVEAAQRQGRLGHSTVGADSNSTTAGGAARVWTGSSVVPASSQPMGAYQQQQGQGQERQMNFQAQPMVQNRSAQSMPNQPRQQSQQQPNFNAHPMMQSQSSSSHHHRGAFFRTTQWPEPEPQPPPTPSTEHVWPRGSSNGSGSGSSGGYAALARAGYFPAEEGGQGQRQQQQQQQQQQYMQHHFPHHPGGSCSSGMGGFFAGRRERSPGYG